MNPNQVLRLILAIIDFVNNLVRRKKIEDLKNAKTTALDERDQRILEDALGGHAGPVADDKYPGMSVITVESTEKKSKD